MPMHMRSGRSASGRLRNFGAMSDEKFNGVYRQVKRENNDPEALQAVGEAYSQRYHKVVDDYGALDGWGAPAPQTFSELLDELLSVEDA